jgi:hypothetical protein
MVEGRRYFARIFAISSTDNSFSCFMNDTSLGR